MNAGWEPVSHNQGVYFCYQHLNIKWIIFFEIVLIFPTLYVTPLRNKPYLISKIFIFITRIHNIYLSYNFFEGTVIFPAASLLTLVSLTFHYLSNYSTVLIFNSGTLIVWIHFMPVISICTPWKHQKTRGFLMFLLGIPSNTPRVFHFETTWKQPFPRRFNVEYTQFACRDGKGPMASNGLIQRRI